MKKTLTATLIVTLGVIFLLGFGLSAARAQEGPNEGYGGPMMEKFHQHMEAHWDELAKALNLTAEQQTLFNDMKDKAESYMENKRTSHMEMRRAIRDELSKTNPDLASVAKTAKEDFRSKETPAYDAMVDASVAFFGSLTKDQRDKFEQFHPQFGPQGGRFRGGARNR